MTSTFCSGCGVIVDIPDELVGNDDEPLEPYYCDDCEARDEPDGEDMDFVESLEDDADLGIFWISPTI